ncbi:serpin family protein [Rubricoccus marinus]|uniref:Serpin domain-containing protein n=1 Tax=Rubricoccus marinus TaxID=716817 RepID=A0A259U359_9BACT|nr:serpin family protein [Rubricoccus marinus]OZC04465.1 hypothetical protein BSZ36_16655 [Rubricoccus marinus]
MRLLLALFLLAPLAACDLAGEDAPQDPTPIALSPLAKDLVDQGNSFGVALFAETAAEDDGNLMLSPLSASVALTMLMNGASGDTYDQIHAMLGLAPEADLDAVNAAYADLREQLLEADPDVQFTLANALFHNSNVTDGFPLEAPFLAALRGPFEARVDGLDFFAPEALRTINGWAADQTNDRVETVLSELDPDLVLLLMNALYFKGDWSTPFKEENTRPAAFTLASGETVQAPTMHGGVQALLASGDGYTALEMPYGRRNFSMVVLTPEAGSLADFGAALRGGLWRDATAALDAQEVFYKVDVALPRFSFETDKTLNGTLEALGMTDAFGPRADLSRIQAQLSMVVSFVKQNTFVEVNEEGTEAAAVTTVGVTATSLGPQFSADRPFVFAIRERTTNTLLFIGQVADPTS